MVWPEMYFVLVTTNGHHRALLLFFYLINVPRDVTDSFIKDQENVNVFYIFHLSKEKTCCCKNAAYLPNSSNVKTHYFDEMAHIYLFHFLPTDTPKSPQITHAGPLRATDEVWGRRS